MAKRGKVFLAFNLNDFHEPAPALQVGVRIVGAKSLNHAKEFMRMYYHDNAWAVVDKDVFDRGIVYAGPEWKSHDGGSP